MSTTIDERVVEMRFDNRQFESNVQTSMSTIDKLKQKLNFNGASKGLDNINTAAKNVNMTVLGSAVETVKTKFSALEVMGVTALANITNQAVNAGKRIVSALTIDPIKTGYSEYETKINAVQVIQANTRGKNTMEDITAALDELNTYADKTIYNFAQMTSNIGKFTAQGLDVQQASKAVQGMANLAAASGASAEDMARATYQMSQALGGTIKLMDWTSLRTANMATTTLKETLMDLARVNGVAIDDMIAKHGSFEQTLSEGWLSGSMFSEAMNIYSGVYSEAELKAKGFNDEQVKNFIDLAKMAESAATEVKTFTQLWDVLKETAQSGWTQTWELIIGDFDTAKRDLTALQNYFSDIINSWSDARNKLLESAFVKGFKDLADKIKELVKPASKAVETIQETVEAVTDLGKVVDDVIFGKFGDGQERFDALTKAGVNYYEVQNKVNETLGNSFRYTQEQIDAQKKVLGTQTKVTEATENMAEATSEITDADAERLEMLSKLSDEQLKAQGYNDKQIEAFKELRDVSEKLGIPIRDLVKNIDEINGRWLFIESFKNIGQGLIKTFKAIGKAFRDIFPPMTADQLFDIIAGFHKLSTKLKPTGKTLDNIRRIFRGLFAAIDVVAKITGGAFKIAFEVVKGLLDHFNGDILDLAANVGDAIVKFNDWLDSLIDVQGVVEVIGPIIQTVVQALADLVKLIGESDGFQSFIDLFKSIGKSFGEWFKGLKETDDIPKYIFEGLVNGIIEWTPKVVEALFNLGTAIIESICKVLGIESPSTVFIAIGGFIMAGLAIGIRDGWGEVWNVVTDIFSNIVTFIQNLDLGTVIAGAVAIGITGSIWKISSALEAFASPFDGLGDFLEELGDGTKALLKGIGSSFKASAWKKRGQAILMFAGAIALLAGSVWLLAQLDAPSLWNAVGAIGALAIFIGILAGAMAALGKVPDLKIGKLSVTIFAFAMAITALAAATWILSTIDPNSMESCFQFVLGFAAIIVSLMAISGKISASGGKFDKIGMAMAGVAVAMLIMAGVAKIISGMALGDIMKSAVGIAALGFIIAFLIKVVGSWGEGKLGKIGTTLIAVSVAMLLMVGVMKVINLLKPEELLIGAVGVLYLAWIVENLIKAVGRYGKGKIASIGATILAISAAMLLLVGVMKLIGGMKTDELVKGSIGVAALGALIAILIKVVGSWGEGQLAKIGTTILAISIAMLILAGVAKIIETMSWEGMLKAGIGLGALVVVVAALVGIVKAAGSDIAKIGVTLLLLSGSIAILAGVALVLSLISWEGLAKGVGAVSVLGIIMALLIKACKEVSDCKSELLMLTIAIGVMAGAVALLSLIEPDRLLPASLALSMLMGMFGLMAKMAGKMNSSLSSVIIMAVIVAALAGIIALMTTLENVDAVVPIAASLSGLLLTLSAACKIMSTIPATAATSAATGLLKFMGVILLIVGVLGLLMLIPGVDTVLANGGKALGLIGYAIGNFIGSIIGGFGAGISSGLPAIGKNLSAFMIYATPFITGIQMLVGPKLLDNVGILAGAILALTGADLVNSLASIFTGKFSLPMLGWELSMFMINARHFISGANQIKPAAMKGVKTLAEAAILLTGANLIDGITRLFGCESSLSDFGEELETFGPHVAEFAKSIKDVNGDQLTASANAIKVLIEAFDGMPESGGLLQKFLGEGMTMDVFGEQLKKFGYSLYWYGAALEGANFDTINGSVNSVKSFVDIAKSLQSITTGGIFSGLLGDGMTMDTFGEQLKKFGTGLYWYAANLEGANLDNISKSIDGVKGLVEVANTLSGIKSGGWLQAVTGDSMTMDQFAEDIGKFGYGMYKYASCFDSVNMDNITKSADGAKALVEVANTLSGIKSGGWLQAVTGDSMTMDQFGEQLKKFGYSMYWYASALEGTNFENIAKSVDMAKALSGMAANLPDSGWWADLWGNTSIDEFGSQLKSFGVAMKEYSTEIGGVDFSAFGTATTQINRLVTLADKISDTDFGGFASLGEALRDAGVVGIDGFIEAFTDGYDKASTAARELVDTLKSKISEKFEDIKTLGTKLIGKLASGIAKAKSSITVAINSLVFIITHELKDGYEDFYNAGSYLVTGFAAGINDNTYKATAKSRAMASASLTAAKNELRVKSPSKEFYAVGKFAGMGFVNALDDYGHKAYVASADMASSAKSGLGDAIATVRNLIEGDWDVQPTIRPVLDLSDVRAGAGSIGSMLNFGSSVGLMANVGAISSAMNRNSQNGKNGEVVGAINRLRKDLGNVGNNTYNINGVTYDDGSNVSDAVKVLVRAARVERRK